MNKTFVNTLTLGFALFAIFFGAGNLIFPPLIGQQSGTNWIPALIGFSITGIVLPLLAVIAILNAGGKFEVLTRHISPWFYKAFNLLLMVGIGMFVTIPRMAATTHELGTRTLFPQVPLLITILIYFAVCFYFSMDRSNVIEKIGNILTPLLVIILLIIVGKGVFDPIGAPVVTELAAPFSHAFISAYQTGDVITGILCAPIFISAIISFGYKGRQVRKIALTATLIAGLSLLVVYGGMLYIGASGSDLFPEGIESTALVAGIVDRLLGGYGAIALAIAIVLACLTSTIGVIAVTAEFLNKLVNNRISYRAFALLICAAGASVGLMGVDNIIHYAMPIFLALYPVAIVLVILGVFYKWIPNPGSYRGTVLLTFIVSLFETVGSLGWKVPFLYDLITKLPFSSNGFTWLVPAIVGFVLGTILCKTIAPKQEQEHSALPMAETES